MKASRILSLFLSLTMALGLCAPAWAAEEPTPEEAAALAETYGLDAPADYITVDVEDLVDMSLSPALLEEDHFDFDAFLAQYTAAHPAEHAAFDADAYWAESIGDYWESKAEYMAIFGLADEAAFREDMWADYVSSTPDHDAAYTAWQSQQDAKRVEAYRAAHPGELEALSMEELLAREGYPDPMSEYMADYGFSTEAEAVQGLLISYIERQELAEERRLQAEIFRTARPDLWEAFDLDVYFAERYWYYDTKEEFIESWGFTGEAEMADYLFISFVQNAMEEERPYWRQDEPSLVVNGMTDYDAAITAENGVSYTDAATLDEILGTALTGEKVAIRAAAEAAGWDVTWNAKSNEVVLLDREALLRGFGQEISEADRAEAEAAGVDVDALLKAQDFSNFDAMMDKVIAASAYDPAKSYKTTETSTLTLTAFNTLDGDEKAALTMKGEVVMKGRQIRADLSLDAGQVLGLLSDQTVAAFKAALPKYQAADLEGLLSGLELHVIVNGETGDLYVNCPALQWLDGTIAAETWFHVELEDELELVWTMLDHLTTEGWDTGEMLYDLLLRESAETYSATGAYTSFVMMRGMLGGLIGGDRVKAQGGGYVWSLDAQDLSGMAQAITGAMGAGADVDVSGWFKEYEVSLSVDANGRQKAQAVVRPDMDALADLVAQAAGGGESDGAVTALMTWALGLFDFRMESRSEGTADRATETAQFHWKNQFKLDVETSARRVETQDLPAALPAGAVVVDLDSDPV